MDKNAALFFLISTVASKKKDEDSDFESDDEHHHHHDDKSVLEGEDADLPQEELDKKIDKLAKVCDF